MMPDHSIQKSTTVSAFGVDHGGISKSFKQTARDIKTEKHATHGRIAAGAVFPGFHAAAAGKRGKKLRAAGNEVGGAMVGGLLVPVAGGPAGGILGTQRAARKGYYKKQEKGAL
jgi:hypothetical protein